MATGCGIVRQMTITDIDQVYELEHELFPNPWPKSFFESDLQRPSTIALVTEHDRQVIAYALANCYDVELHITNIAVDARFQRKGQAARLVDELERNASVRGCTHAYLEVRTANSGAIELYRKIGYTIAYTRSKYYIDGDDAYVMQKSLDQGRQ
ncbi:MAG TPA: ribosomal protein S18-alanine N-acetyltransferase [bacterium]